MPTKRQIAALALIARPDRLLYGSDHVRASHQLALKLLSDLEATMPAIDQDWRTPTTRNAEQLFTTHP
ncbi:hypothetical protein [Streptomyces spiralis]|uniref:hypothetical protein n=1 Tax=Streptomyces spiralis TaxID=66376 RepID=UPI0033D44E1C